MNQQEIIQLISQFMQEEHSGEKEFNELALQLFSYQYQNNLPYRTFCMQKGKTPRMVKTWKEIPSVPINAFKEAALSCIDPDTAEAIFMTSGTTKGIRGKHYHPSLHVYDQSMVLNFKQRFMKHTDKIRMGVLFPTEKAMPNSSLAHYLALAAKEFGTENSHYLINENGIDMNHLLKELHHAEETGEPYALIGASYSFVHMLDELASMGKTFTLPKGSKILDTGGFKNQSKELELDEFYRLLSATLGVSRSDCINMYGVTELSTQFYDDGNESVPSIKTGPHWIRTRVINPLTGEEVPKGERGVLVHCDLGNFNSVTTILTEDAGIETENGFILLGRVQGTEAKGCSIAVEEFLKATKEISE
ncbi:LuxE/PaaK family acyltransferase [Domibacillus epiphyticus]|uniref:Long-chain fatty acid--CoA ligase n=1 Tax=Domibacillus epiphyticus TaxID=1714355 RepID=A0A1V2A5A7_9BACI|nr:long-chain fatty acid--CoA ligase [Domibacillus epiphyticus]OMP66042.1 long-chain fatty acid--CoA ligase [Domibacillus epiphyticus]